MIHVCGSKTKKEGVETPFYLSLLFTHFSTHYSAQQVITIISFL